MPTMHLTITTIGNKRGIAFYNKIFVDQVLLLRHLRARLPLQLDHHGHEQRHQSFSRW